MGPKNIPANCGCTLVHLCPNPSGNTGVMVCFVCYYVFKTSHKEVEMYHFFFVIRVNVSGASVSMYRFVFVSMNEFFISYRSHV